MKAWAYLGILYLSLYLKEQGKALEQKQKFFEEYSFLELEVTENHILEQKNLIRFEAEMDQDQRMREFGGWFEHSPIAEYCCALAIAEYYVPVLGSVFEKISGIRRVTLETGFILAGGEDMAEYTEEIYEAYTILRDIFCLDGEEGDYFRSGLIVDFNMIQCLVGKRGWDLHIQALTYPVQNWSDQSSGVCEEEIKNDAKIILSLLKKEEKCFAVHIVGDRMSGKKRRANRLAMLCGISLLLIDFETASEAYEKNQKTLSYIIRTLLLSRVSLCFFHVTLDTERKLNFFKTATKRLRELNVLYFLLSESSREIAGLLKGYVYRIKIPPNDGAQSAALWDRFLNQYFPEEAGDLDPAVIASSVTLPADMIEMAVRQLYFSGRKVNRKNLFQCCFVLNQKKYDESIQELQPAYGMEDLRIPEKEKQVLFDICNQVRFRIKVFEEWGMGKRYRYGTGASALFYGPPGTGKTMAAHAIADELNLFLLRVDLSQTMDKYIGETEKRLDQIFRMAEGSNAVLFFDEADAIFGKRGEIKDAHDRYSNVEVSYVLQKIEDFGGIVILATNFAENIDGAFLRRIRYLVRFSMPDTACRREIWEGLLKGGAPVENMNLEYLSSQFLLTGASIKNIYLNALFRAAAGDGVVRMETVLQCIHQEYLKEGKILAQQDFGEYGFLVKT